MKTLIIGLLAAASLAAALPAVAQPLDQREHRQEQRVHHAVRLHHHSRMVHVRHVIHARKHKGESR